MSAALSFAHLEDITRRTDGMGVCCVCVCVWVGGWVGRWVGGCVEREREMERKIVGWTVIY